jgi:hypothetical protein
MLKTAGAERLLVDRFRCEESLVDFHVTGHLSDEQGYFRLGSDAICYGQLSSGVPARNVTDALHDACKDIRIGESSVHFPFDPVEVVDNLLYERYAASSGTKTVSGNNTVRSMYYLVRPLLGTAERKYLQRLYFRSWKDIAFPKWPVDRTVERVFEQLMILSMKARRTTRLPFIWFWPEGAPSCTTVTHDVETSAGWKFCSQLMDLDDLFGIKSSFQIIPEERYKVSLPALESLKSRGFEVNVHDLNHDGRLFRDRELFLRRAEGINRHAKRFGSLGFRSGSLYRNTEWYHALDVSYDMSIPNVAHLDPQRGGCCTVLPFFIGEILELPLTTTQDYSLFHILKDYSIRLWEEQISLIREKHGLISFNVHPDCVINQSARRVYAELLQRLSRLREDGQTWICLPNEVAAWWRLRNKMNLVNVGGSWSIEGEGRERARLAYAVLVDNSLTYELPQVCDCVSK